MSQACSRQAWAALLLIGHDGPERAAARVVPATRCMLSRHCPRVAIIRRSRGVGDGWRFAAEVMHAAVQGPGAVQGGCRPERGLAGDGRGRPDAGRRAGPRQPLDHQLQGRAGHHRQGAGRAPLADDPRHRLRRHGGLLHPRRVQGRRRGDPQRLGRRRDAFRRLRADGPRQRRLADQEAGSFHACRDHGHRHRRLYGHAVRAGARKAGRAADQRAGAGDRCSGRRRQRGDRAAGEARLPGDGLHRPHRRAALPERPRRGRGDRPQPAGRHATHAQQGTVGGCRGLRSAARRSPTC